MSTITAHNFLHTKKIKYNGTHRKMAKWHPFSDFEFSPVAQLGFPAPMGRVNKVRPFPSGLRVDVVL